MSELAGGNILELSDLRRDYIVSGGFFSGKKRVLQAVAGLDLSLARGEALGLVGESGCGKSTLARLCVGLEQPSAGKVLLDGEPPLAGSGRAQMIFQDPFSSLSPRKSIGWSVAEGLYAKGLKRAARRAKVLSLLDLVGLRPELYGRYPHQFSGGQRQRAAIARALAPDPGLVVCDEPVSALDVSIQAQVINLLADLRERLGLSYLFISHDLAVVGHICERIAVMYLGRLMELAPSRELLARPLHPYTQALLEAVPLPLPGRKSHKLILRGDPPSPLSPPEGCVFHPRCPKADEACRASEPVWREIEPGHLARCHYPLTRDNIISDLS